jgi:hypothetical protein
MQSPSFLRQLHPHRSDGVLPAIAARTMGSRFATPCAVLAGSPALSRPNLFSGD